MTRFLFAAAAAMCVTAVGAMAQTTTTTQTTTSVTRVPVVPITMTTTTTKAAATRHDGDKTATTGVAVSNGFESASNSITNMTYPFSSMMTTTQTERRSVNGVTTETVTTTNTWPHMIGRPDVPPEVTTKSRVIASR